MNHCPNCQREINSNLSNCPYCSFPLPKMEYDINVQDNKQKKNNIETPKEVKEEVKPYEPNDFDKFEESIAKFEPTEKKSKKGLVFIIFLILIILGLSGFIVYDKLLKKQPTKVKVQTETKEEFKLITNYMLTEQEALGLGNYLWNYALDTVWCNNFTYSEETTDLEDGSKAYEITNYNDVSNNFSSDFKYEYKDKEYNLSDIFDNHVLNDKYYDVNKCNKEKDTTYGNTILKIKDNQLGNIKYTATSNYCENLPLNEECKGDKITKTIDKEFNITKDGETWKIQKFSVPN